MKSVGGLGETIQKGSGHRVQGHCVSKYSYWCVVNLTWGISPAGRVTGDSRGSKSLYR